MTDLSSFENFRNYMFDAANRAGLENLTEELLNAVWEKTSDVILSGLHLLAKVVNSLIYLNGGFQELSARILLDHYYSQTTSSFVDTTTRLYETSPKMNNPRVSERFYKFCKDHPELDEWIDHDYDRAFDYFGVAAIMGYSLTIDQKAQERPQHIFMRMAIVLANYEVEKIRQIYLDMGRDRYYIHATPTIFNSGTSHQQQSSCFLLPIKDDSIEGIFSTLKDVALISKYCGGVGISISNIRARGTPIATGEAKSTGIIPVLKIFDQTTAYVDQEGRRPGAVAVYLEPWHADFMDFLQIKRVFNADSCRNLFTGVWMPDLFMKRLLNNEEWSFFCPSVCGDLQTTFGGEFEDLYKRYEEQGLAVMKKHTKEIWLSIIASVFESGTPYILFKDTVNANSNHQHLGTIRGSNLCTEIFQYNDGAETATCNLASLCLPSFVRGTEFNFERLRYATRQLVRNLNVCIDNNYYPIPSAKTSNSLHRPIGIGVQGLADTFALLDCAYGDERSQELNRQIFANIYFAALTESCSLAKEYGPFPSWDRCPVKTTGRLHCDRYGHVPHASLDWHSLRSDIGKHGLYNSLHVALMPTASVSQVMGNTETVEAFPFIIFSRLVKNERYVVVNKHFVRDMGSAWGERIYQEILDSAGSVQNIRGVSDRLKTKYKTVWEIPYETANKMMQDISHYIDQGSSSNVYIASNDVKEFTKVIVDRWHRKLKTGCYYLRTIPKLAPPKFSCKKEESEETCQACQ